MTLFRPRDGSACVGAGMFIRHGGARDLTGRPLPATKHPTLGACEPEYARGSTGAGTQPGL